MKKIYFLFLINFLVFLLYINHDWPFLSLAFGLISVTSVALILLILKRGLYVLVDKIIIDRIQYVIRDRIIPFSSNRNFRELIEVGSGAYISRINYHSLVPWAYLDIVRLLIPNISIKKILIIGGGGGSLSYYFSKTYPSAVIHTVEKSSKMISVARKYFLNGFKKNLMMHDDGLHYLRSSTFVYDVIIVDVFKGAEIPQEFVSSLFFSAIKKCMDNSTFILINLGIVDQTPIAKVVRKYLETFHQKFQLIKWNNNYIGIINQKSYIQPVGKLIL